MLDVLDPVAPLLHGRGEPLLRLWGDSTYLGPDAGMASPQDLAMLVGMYLMFAGFLHGAAMVERDGVSATDFATRAMPFLAAMTGAFAEFAAIIDRRDYTGEGQQSLDFSEQRAPPTTSSSVEPQAQLTVFLTALSGVLQATALVAASGVAAADFVPDALVTLAAIPAMLEGGAEVARAIETGVHPGDLSTVAMMGATAQHILAASDAAGIDLALPLAIKSHYDRALAAGHGRDNWTSLFEVIRRTEN